MFSKHTVTMAHEIQILTKQHEKKLIAKAAREVGIGHSTFCKMVSLKEAKKVLREGEDDEKRQRLKT